MMNSGAVRDSISCGPRTLRSMRITKARTRSPTRRFSFGIIWSRGSTASTRPDLDHGVAALDALDRAGDQVLAAAEEVVQDLLALGVADLLQDDLLRGLRADAAEFDRLQRLLDVVADLDVGDLVLGLGQQDLVALGIRPVVFGHDLPAAEGLVLAGFAVDRHAHVDLVLEALLGRRGERQLQRDEHDVLGHVLFARQRVDQQQQFAAHVSLQHYSFGTSRARSRSASSNASWPPSKSSSTRSPLTARTTPTKFLRPLTGERSRTSASQPAKRAKSAAFFSLRSRPGEDTSSRSYLTLDRQHALQLMAHRDAVVDGDAGFCPRPGRGVRESRGEVFLNKDA